VAVTHVATQRQSGAGTIARRAHSRSRRPNRPVRTAASTTAPTKECVIPRWKTRYSPPARGGHKSGFSTSSDQSGALAAIAPIHPAAGTSRPAAARPGAAPAPSGAGAPSAAGPYGALPSRAASCPIDVPRESRRALPEVAAVTDRPGARAYGITLLDPSTGRHYEARGVSIRIGRGHECD